MMLPRIKVKSTKEELSLKEVKSKEQFKKETSQSFSRIKHYGFEQDQWNIPTGFGAKGKDKQGSGMISTRQHSKFASSSKMHEGTKSSETLIIKKQQFSNHNTFSMSEKNMVNLAEPSIKKGNPQIDNSLYTKEVSSSKLKIKEIHGFLSVAQNLCNLDHLDTLAKRELPVFFERSQTLMTSTDCPRNLIQNSLYQEGNSFMNSQAKGNSTQNRHIHLRGSPTRIRRNYPVADSRILTDDRLPTTETDSQGANQPNFNSIHKKYKEHTSLGVLTFDLDTANSSRIASIDTNNVFKMVNKVEERQKKNMLQIRLNAHTLLLKKLYRKFKDESIQRRRHIKEEEQKKVARLQPNKVRKMAKKKVDVLSKRFQECIYNQSERVEDMLNDVREQYKLEGSPQDVVTSPVSSRNSLSDYTNRQINLNVEEVKPEHVDLDDAFSSSGSRD